MKVCARIHEGQTPNTNLQTPDKHQTSNIKDCVARRGCGESVFEGRLVFGNWDLVLFM
jgi:hypothetical protein